MIQQGLAELEGLAGIASDSVGMQQSSYDAWLEKGRELGRGYAIETRVYAESPAAQFRPCPGVLQYVNIPSAKYEWLRVETWVCPPHRVLWLGCMIWWRMFVGFYGYHGYAVLRSASGQTRRLRTKSR
jgi:hypothetical protein